MAEEKRDDLGNIRRLIADALHIRDHFECCRNLPQVACDRLLLQKQLQTQRFDAPFLLVCLFLQFGDRCGGRRVLIFERLRGKTDGLRARFAHLRQLFIQQGKLLVKFASHYPNLPVM